MYQPKGDINSRHNGSLISSEQGQALAFRSFTGKRKFLLIQGPSVQRTSNWRTHENNDLEVNVIKGKKLTNMRSAGADGAAKIAPKINFSLEESMEYIKDDEYFEATPG